MKIFDLKGNIITTLLNKEMNPGYYFIDSNASNLSTEIYFITLNAIDFFQIHKILLVK